MRRRALELLRAEPVRAVAPAVGLAAVFVLARVIIALSPTLSETYYDEALTGLMSLAILQGIPQVFYWGQPYLAALDAYLAAAAFHFFGASTLVLRLGIVWVSVFWVWAAWRIGRRIAGERWGLLAGLQIALPPIFLTFVQLSSHAEGVALALGTLTLAAAVRLVDPLPRGRQWWAWVVLGVAAGLGWWTSQMATMLIAAAAVGLLVARPGVLAGIGPYAALGLFFLAGLPFWIWNVHHEWATFHHLVEWGGALPGFGERIHNAGGTLVQALGGGAYWDSRAVPLAPWARVLGWLVVVAVYVPAAGLAAGRVVIWIWRIARRTRPWHDPLDMVALAFWLTLAAQLFTWFGTSGVMRYSLTFFGPLPLLVSAALARLAQWGRAGRATAIALAVALVAFNLTTHVAFVRAGAGDPVRPVDAAIAEMETLGTTACYADSRIAQVLSFESTERIVCADHFGLRDYASLRTVNRIESPETVAIVTHRTIKGPAPGDMARTLTRIGGTAQTATVGKYVIFHHFTPPDPQIRPIPPAGWRARASSASADAALVLDRRTWTRWMVPKNPGEWLEVDLGRARPITQVSLLAAPWVADSPPGLRVETSEDGQHWQTVSSDRDILPGAHWWKGHPRLDDSGRVVVHFAPHPARYVRLTDIGAPWPGGQWSVSELFVYETAEYPWAPPAPAVSALTAATGELDHWMDDPTGPNPLRAPYTFEHRRRQVHWATVFGAADEALAAAPDWEEAHHVYARALGWAGWGRGPEWLLDQAFKDGAWQEVLRLSDLVDAQPNVAWRAGREEARAEALEKLGRPAEAAAIRALPDPVPSRSVRIQFGKDLELVGVDVPPEARPGDTVRLDYYWHLLGTTSYDYWVFLHVIGLAGSRNHDEMVGGYGSSNWAAGERVRQIVTFRVPPDAKPGTYPLRVGVWLPSTGRRLHILSSNLPQARRTVTLGSLVVR
jgi:F5/8 type C domain-containing protein/dolichyl-phosphate-mannose-protein mannosyltransferase